MEGTQRVHPFRYPNKSPEDECFPVIKCKLINVCGRWKTQSPSGNPRTARGVHIFGDRPKSLPVALTLFSSGHHPDHRFRNVKSDSTCGLGHSCPFARKVSSLYTMPRSDFGTIPIFVVRLDSKLVLSRPVALNWQPRRVGHIDLADGEPIIFAGEIMFGGSYSGRGVLRWWNDRTGHLLAAADTLDLETYSYLARKIVERLASDGKFDVVPRQIAGELLETI